MMRFGTSDRRFLRLLTVATVLLAAGLSGAGCRASSRNAKAAATAGSAATASAVAPSSSD